MTPNGLNMVRLAFQCSKFSIYYYVYLLLSPSYLALSAKCTIFGVTNCNLVNLKNIVQILPSNYSHNFYNVITYFVINTIRATYTASVSCFNKNYGNIKSSAVIYNGKKAVIVGRPSLTCYNLCSHFHTPIC